MKNITKLFAIATVVLGFATTSFAQGVTATATTTAKIITPLAITKTVDMDFGTLAVNNTAGTVLLSTTNSRTPSGGVSLPTVTGTVSAAKFTVTGLDASTYSITLPSAPITLSDGASHTMTVGSFTSTPSSTGLLTSSTQEIVVGATLNVAGSQAAGTYTNAAGLEVSVNYN